MKWYSFCGQEAGQFSSCCGSYITKDVEQFNKVNQGITVLLSDTKLDVSKLDNNGVSNVAEIPAPNGWMYVKELQEPEQVYRDYLIRFTCDGFPHRRFDWKTGYGEWQWVDLSSEYIKEIPFPKKDAIFSCHTGMITPPSQWECPHISFNVPNSLYLFIEVPVVWENYDLTALMKARGLKLIYEGPRSWNSNYLENEDGDEVDEDDTSSGSGKRLQFKVFQNA